MRFETAQINPLGPLLQWIPEEGVVVTEQVLTAIALFFKSGGIVCESLEEVMHSLVVLIDMQVLDLKDNILKVIINVDQNPQ